MCNKSAPTPIIIDLVPKLYTSVFVSPPPVKRDTTALAEAVQFKVTVHSRYQADKFPYLDIHFDLGRELVYISDALLFYNLGPYSPSLAIRHTISPYYT